LIRDDLGLAWVNNTGSHESQHLWGSDVDDVGRRGFPPLLYLSDLVLRECRSVSSSTMPIGHFLYIAWSETGHHNYELVDAPITSGTRSGAVGVLLGVAIIQFFADKNLSICPVRS
jgi:hypothetical protein